MIRIGTRGSQLALWQAHWIEGRLNALGEACRIEIIKTTGDAITGVPLAKIGGKGLFTKEIEEALLAGAIDVAVHSLKDMPTALPSGLMLAAIPEREDVRDAMVGKRLDELAAGAKVGTSSLRRAAQLRALRPDLRVETLRGNLDTRLRKLDDGQYDAIVLAAAGLRRLGWEDRISERVPIETICPAPGQGALAIETCVGDGQAIQLCAQLNDPNSCAAVTAERAALAALGGGCQVPIGAYAEVANESLYLRAVVISPDATHAVRGEERGPAAEPEAVGRRLGERLLNDGAREILAAVDAASLT